MNVPACNTTGSFLSNEYKDIGSVAGYSIRGNYEYTVPLDDHVLPTTVTLDMEVVVKIVLQSNSCLARKCTMQTSRDVSSICGFFKRKLFRFKCELCNSG